MDGEQQTHRKRKPLVIDDDEEEDFVPQSFSTPASVKQQEKKESSVETQKNNQSTSPAPTKQIKDTNGNNKPAPTQQNNNNNNSNLKTNNNNSSSNNNNNNLSKNGEKVVRKEQERVQNIQQKMEVDSDGHASDRDLFLPDDSNSQDIQEIRAKFGWKPKVTKPAQSASKSAPKPIQAQKNTSSRQRDEPVRKGKDTVVYEVLKRWWYAMPDWPPAHYDYAPALESHKLRLVNKQKFRIAPDLDEKGFAKCYEILGYAGMFKDYNNKLYDLRPEEGKPSYNSLCRKSENELINLLKVALERQVEDLSKSKVVDEELLLMLRRQYEKVKLRATSH